MTEQDKKKFKTVPAMDMDEYKQKIREHRLKILKRTLVTALIVFVIIAGLFLFLALRHYEDFDVNSTVERSDTAATIFEEFQGNILKYSNEVLCIRILIMNGSGIRPMRWRNRLSICVRIIWPYMTKRERRFTS